MTARIPNPTSPASIRLVIEDFPMPGWPCTQTPVLETSPVRSQCGGVEPDRFGGVHVPADRHAAHVGAGGRREREQPAHLAGGAGEAAPASTCAGAAAAAGPAQPHGRGGPDGRGTGALGS